jgi:hypothetical protein
VGHERVGRPDRWFVGQSDGTLLVAEHDKSAICSLVEVAHNDGQRERETQVVTDRYRRILLGWPCVTLPAIWGTP